MQLILGALIITPCKKRRQSISAASWLALLTFLFSNSCSCYVFSDCPKHGIKGGTEKMAKNVFGNGNTFNFLFYLFLIDLKFLMRFWVFSPSSPSVCARRLHFWCLHSLKVGWGKIRFAQNFPGGLKRSLCASGRHFKQHVLMLPFFSVFSEIREFPSWERLEGLFCSVLYFIRS